MKKPMKDKSKASRPFQKDEEHENVLRVDFAKAKEERTLEASIEDEWGQTHARLIDSLTGIGALFGDDEELMTRKADAVYDMLHTLVEDAPPVMLTSQLPQGLTNEQAMAVVELLKQAGLKSIEVTVAHAAQVLMGGMYDLCTSKLKPRK